MGFDVFISHSSKDKRIADAVRSALEANRIRCWIAPRDIRPGQDWSLAIIEGLSECVITVLIFSQSANDSLQVRREVQRSFEKGLSVIPLRVEDVIPTGAMEYYLSSVHWLNALTPPIEPHLDQLAEAVLGLLPNRPLNEPEPVAAASPPDLFAPVASLPPASPSPTASPSENRPAPSRVGVLPVPATPLVGREKEIEEAKRLILSEDSRLLTLSGPGGIGKTRIALQVGRELQSHFKDGVLYVSLSDISDSRLMLSEIALACGIRESGNGTILENLQNYFKDKRLLLILDNFEQVSQAAPDVSQLLIACPSLKTLVTSRAILRISGEREYIVQPLSQPNPKKSLSFKEYASYPSIQLFIDRARAVKSDFALTQDNAETLCEICRRLDGLPLAIELAAARIRLLTPQSMLPRLQSRLKLLTGGSKDLPARQQTLRGAFDWSFDLLEDDEKKLFQRLSVFAGGFTLEAAEAATDPLGDLSLDILDGLESLAGKSLIQHAAEENEEPRFTMLSTIREYVEERLKESGEEATIRLNHADYYLDLTERTENDLVGPNQAERLEMLETEHDNFRAALAWYRSNDDCVELEMRLAAALWRFWEIRGYLTEGREHLSHALSVAGAVIPPELRASALNGAGTLTCHQGDHATGRMLSEESLAIFRELGHDRGIAASLNSLGLSSFTQGDYEAAHQYFAESLDLRRRSGDKSGIAISLNNLGSIAHALGDYEASRPLYEESLASFRKIGDRRGIAMLLNNLGDLANERGRRGDARAFYQESLVIFRDLQEKRGLAIVLNNLGNVEYAEEGYEKALPLYEESLSIFREIGNKMGVAIELGDLGRIASDRGESEDGVSFYEESLSIYRELKDQRGIADSLASIGKTRLQKAMRTGDLSELREIYAVLRESGELRERLKDREGLSECLRLASRIALLQGDAEKAARLAGTAESLSESGEEKTSMAQDEERRSLIREIAESLGEERYQRERERGREILVDQIVATIA